MSAHRAWTDMFLCNDEAADPGASGTITVNRSPHVVPLVSAGAETRTLARPTRIGTRAFLYMRTDGGDITLTVTGGYNESGSTTFTFSDPGQFIELVSAYDGTNYYWRKTSDHLSAVAGTGSLAVGDDEVLSLGGVARLSWDTTDANANALLLQMPAGGVVDVPVLAVGQSIESVDLGLFNGLVDPTVAFFGVGAVTTGSTLRFYKARGTVASPTVVTAGDDLGSINFYTCVAAGEYVLAAQIRADAQATQATTRGPASLSISTATDAAPSVLTEAIGISKAQLVTLASASVTGDLKINLTLTAGADGVGSSGEQLTSGGAAAECNWAAAGSLREAKTILGELTGAAGLALERVLGAKVYAFRYKEGARPTTGDYHTVYHGIMADEYPQMVHHNGRIFNPVSAAGELILALQALAARVAQLEKRG